MADKSILNINLEEGISLSKLIKIVKINISLITFILSFMIIFINTIAIFYQLGEASYWGIPYKILLNESFSFISVLFFPLIVGIYFLISQMIIFIRIKNKMRLCNKYDTVLTKKEYIIHSLILVISFELCLVKDKGNFLYLPFNAILLAIIFLLMLILKKWLKKKSKYKRMFIKFIKKANLKYSKKNLFQLKLIYKYNFMSFYVLLMITISLDTMYDMDITVFIIGMIMIACIVFISSLVISFLSTLVMSILYFTIIKKYNTKNILNSKINLSKIIIFLSILGVILIYFNILGQTLPSKTKDFYRITINSSSIKEDTELNNKHIIIYETTQRYIVAEYDEDDKGNNIINNETLKYINKSENVTIEKVKLKNIKLKSRMY